MIELYYWPTPNGWKISIALEELGLPYQVMPVNLGKGAQFEAAFLAISPNNRIPAIVDHQPADGSDALSLFESGAILNYLAEKSGQLMPNTLHGKMQVQQWLMWQVGGLGPMLGQHGHFKLYAEEKIPYAINRYATETRRLYQVLDQQLALSENFICGEYSIADIAIFPWIMTHKAQGLTLDDYPGIKRWYATVRAREAVQRGLAVGKEWRQKEMDEEARKNLFGNNNAK
jgi:GST-like protein